PPRRKRAYDPAPRRDPEVPRETEDGDPRGADHAARGPAEAAGMAGRPERPAEPRVLGDREAQPQGGRAREGDRARDLSRPPPAPAHAPREAQAQHPRARANPLDRRERGARNA